MKALEEENLSVKPWQMSGDVTAERRPENALLEEHLAFDRMTKLRKHCTALSCEKLKDESHPLLYFWQVFADIWRFFVISSWNSSLYSLWKSKLLRGHENVWIRCCSSCNHRRNGRKVGSADNAENPRQSNWPSDVLFLPYLLFLLHNSTASVRCRLIGMGRRGTEGEAGWRSATLSERTGAGPGEAEDVSGRNLRTGVPQESPGA